MKVFATNYLEGMSSDTIGKNQDWSWNPANGSLDKIIACGAHTATSISTYASEKDENSDDDQPQEGMLIA